MSDSDSTYTAIIAAIDTQLLAIAQNPTGRFTVGRVTYDGPALMTSLLEMRKHMLDAQKAIPSEGIETMTSFLDDFGRDFMTYANEPDS